MYKVLFTFKISPQRVNNTPPIETRWSNRRKKYFNYFVLIPRSTIVQLQLHLLCKYSNRPDWKVPPPLLLLLLRHHHRVVRKFSHSSLALKLILWSVDASGGGGGGDDGARVIRRLSGRSGLPHEADNSFLAK